MTYLRSVGLSPAYAVRMVAVLSSSHQIMLERQIFYTALTRARKMAIIVGDSRAITAAVRTNRGKQRLTHLDDRLKMEVASSLLQDGI